jgi:glycine oxidase
MGNPTRKPRIAVVGGGVTGAFTAYFLARLGAGAALVERDAIGAHASGSNPGGLNPLHGAGIPGPMEEFALESFRLHVESWDSIRRLSGIDFSPRRSARLHVAMDDEDIAQLERAREIHDRTEGFSAEWIQPDEMLESEPRLSPAVIGGLRTEGNAKVDPRRYTRAVARAAAELGVTVVADEVRGLRHRDGRVTGVLVGAGSIDCDGLVIASGPWCEEPARWLDASIPVEPVKGDMLLAEGSGGGVEPSLAWRDAAVYGTGGDAVWLGGTEEHVGFDATPRAAARATILDRVARILPGLGRPTVVRQTAALRPVTPDGIPIIGAAPGWENACLAVGGGRKGVLLAAGMGLAAAELMIAGSTRMPVSPCSPERWSAAAVG